MIKQTITILLMLSISLQKCSDGCLRCVKPASDNAIPECVFCDTFSHYFLREGSCEKSNDLECELLTQNGQCLRCSNSHYIDLATQKCLQVDDQNRVDKCYRYDDKQNCLQCEGPFVISQNQCIAIEKVIQNCLLYSGDSKCESCVDGYYFDQVIEQCLELNSSPECISHSRFMCFQCEKGLVLDPNYYFDSKFLFQSSIDNEYIFNILRLRQQNKPVMNNDILQCRNSQITNCKTYKNHKECQGCDDGYYLLKDNTCKQYPIQPIPHCLKYQSFNVCKECQQGSVMTGLGKCRLLKDREFISNCNTYSQTARVALCTSCSPEFYVYDNKCIERLHNNVDGCTQYDLFADKCQQCGDGQLIASDGLKCLSEILHCKTYQEFDSQASQDDLVCQACNDLYYLDQNVCQTGTQSNCAQYQTSANICVLCNERFYGSPDCKEHGDVEFCENYSKTQLNVCDKCDLTHRTFNWLEKCEDLPKIDNCEIYEDNTNNQVNQCSQCVSKFALTTDKTCAAIDVNQCIEANWVDNGEDVCTKCDLNFGLAEDNTDSSKSCETPFYYLTNLCDTMKEAQTDFHDFECEICKVHAIPYNFAAHNICVETSKLKFLSSAVTLIDNCEMYSSTTQCQRCAKGWYLKDDRQECFKSQCPDGSGGTFPFYAFEVSVNGSDVVDTVYQNKCRTSQSDEELVYAPDLNDLGEEIIIGCTGNFVKVYGTLGTDDVAYSNVNPANKESQNWVDHILDVYPEVQCPSQPGSGTSYYINGQENTNPISNCQGFSMSAAHNYHCIKCPFGKTGNIASAGNHIESCETMSNCTSNKFKNILPYWEQFFSCHECTETGKIPVIAYDADSKSSPYFDSGDRFAQFTLTNDDNWKNVSITDVELSKHIFCMDVSTEDSIRETLHIEKNDSNYGKVIPLENCGLAVLNLKYTDAFDNSDSQTDAASTDKQALFCGVCAPGFKPTYQGIQAVKCERIDNCLANGEWFNACSGCYPGFRYEYKSNKIHYDSCVRIPFDSPGLDHCLAYERNAPNDEADLSGTCKVCKKGYVLNKDKFCDKIQVSGCSDNSFIAPNDDRDHENNLSFLLYVHQGGNGCGKCDQGYESLPSSLLNKTSYCIGSDYLQVHQLEFPVQTTLDGSDDYDESEFIDKCVKYKSNHDPECSECIEGYILRDDGKACVNNTLFPNCDLFDSTGFDCVKCKPGYGLVTGVYTGCIKNEIENCTTINENTPHDKVTCLKCNDGFYLDNNQCKEGHIPNCAQYESKDVCLTCAEGYWAFGMQTASQTYTTNKTFYCIKKAGETNCKVAKFNSNLGDFKCQTCDEPYQKIVNNQHGANLQENQVIDLSLCLTIGDIENCEEYDKQLYLDKRIFKCTKCNPQNYLNSDGTQCLERKVFFDTCSTYNPTADLCTSCKDNYILNENKKQCDIYPQGISNCLIYKADENDKFQCSKCTNQTYLLDDKCVEIPEEQQIENCAFYNSPTECNECNTGYFLEDNICVKLNLIDCQVPLSSKECKVCNTGFRLFSDDGLNKCISLDKQNCLQFEQQSYNRCLLCKTHYYPDENGDCQVVDDIIQNCIVYSGNKQCKQCQPEYALKWDQTECISKENFDTKCTITMHSSVPTCNVCQAGYQLKNGRCVQFKDEISNGCFYYNKISDDCQFCKLNYHMDSNKKCVLNSDQVIDEQTGDEDSDTDDEEEGMFRLETLFTILVMVLIN